ncbi:MAG: UDP-N-acetylglucosamine 2-epimerase (non-hydrolyzing) [Chloroflexi bacterium]|nr:UDP-N-acetylglucosamine 2-epimerase (non-hydrolyzing) [Chloroflexota bacterium]
MIRILIIIGTRPEAIKMAPVIQLLQNDPQTEVHVCSTGQHRDMLDQVLDLFHIKPDIDLDVMRPNQTPTQVGARVLMALEPLLDDLRPDWMLVQGDTTTVMAASIAAHYRRVRVGHVEAGLRTYDRDNPFPEEMNRVISDHISDLHFAPTLSARDNLLREGIHSDTIHVTGNTVIDALLQIARRPLPVSVSDWFKQEGLDWLDGTDGANDKSLILATAHRRENHGEPLHQICAALRQIAETRPDIYIVYPVHRNPNVWEPVHELLQDVPRITLVPPVDYATLVHLMKRSALILTDSGGIQEEAPSLGIPVLILRETTERPEAMQAGVAKIVGADTGQIVNEVNRLLDDAAAHDDMAQAVNPYGDGRAGQRIIDVLLRGKCEEFVP